MPKFNDINLTDWRAAEDINTDSLWIIDKRDNSGAHSGHYHGNFVPQVVRQLIKRYTKEGDVVLDPFAGSGTTLIEAQRLRRNSLGVELNPGVAEEAISRIRSEGVPGVRAEIHVGDSSIFDFREQLEPERLAQFVIFHPPYWDIIHFSDSEDDLSGLADLDEFLKKLDQVIDNATKALEPGRYCAIVIADKYMKGQVVPLGFYCMELFLRRGFLQKGIIVKNFGETKAKQNQQGIWRYRALASDYYLFKHEYIFVFKKPI